jgi:hypothetical protein
MTGQPPAALTPPVWPLPTVDSDARARGARYRVAWNLKKWDRMSTFANAKPARPSRAASVAGATSTSASRAWSSRSARLSTLSTPTNRPPGRRVRATSRKTRSCHSTDGTWWSIAIATAPSKLASPNGIAAASARTIAAFGRTIGASAAAADASISTQVKRPARRTSAAVQAPGPGPISSSAPLAFTPSSAHGMRSVSAAFLHQPEPHRHRCSRFIGPEAKPAFRPAI